MHYEVVDARISPVGGRLDILSQTEVTKLLNASQGALYPVFRSSALAVLNYGDYLDDGRELLERYQDFDIRVIQEERGIKLDLRSAPANAFVEGKMIRGINEHLFAVLRDIVYVDDTINNSPRFDLTSSNGLTNAVFYILRNAQIMRPRVEPRRVVCWEGIPLPPRNMITARRWATSWDCAVPISAPAVAPER